MHLKVMAATDETVVALPRTLLQALPVRAGDTVIVEPTSTGFVVITDPTSVASQIEVGEAIMQRYAKTLADLA